MPEATLLKARGLYLDENQLSQVPEGAMTMAENLTILNDGVLRPRRGHRNWGVNINYPPGATPPITLIEFLKEAMYFDGTDVYHLLKSGTAPSDSASAVHIAAVGGPAGKRLRAVQFLKSLFFTGSSGIGWLQSPTSAPSVGTVPGVPRCGDCKSVALNSGGAHAWLSNNGAVSYRACLIRRSNNGFLMFGAPGGLVQATNTTGALVDTTVTIALPPALGLDTGYILQVYRTTTAVGTTSSNIPSPGEEMYLVYEGNLVQSDITNGYTTVNDITPDGALGATAYWAPSQGGILVSNQRPPYATDIESFREYLFAANTKQRDRVIVRLLGVSGQYSNSLYAGLCLQLTTTNSRVYLVADTVNTGQRFALVTNLDAASNISGTVKNLVDCINRLNLGIVAGSLESADDFNTVGEFYIEAVDFSQSGQLSIGGNDTHNFTYSWNSANSVCTVTTSTPHGLDVNARIETLINNTNFSATVASIVSSTVFTYNTGTQPAGGATGSGTYTADISYTNHDTPYSPNLATAVPFDTSAKANRLCYSKRSQPYAFTLTGYIDVGGEEYALKRVKRLGSTLFLFKEHGLYRLVGTDETNWRVEEFDPNVDLVGEDTISEVDGRLYCLTTMGVIELTEGGKRVISRPIEQLLMPYIDQGTYDIEQALFSVGRRSDHQYILFIPQEGSRPAIGLCYSVYEQAWTSRTDSATSGLELLDGRLLLSNHVQVGMNGTSYPQIEVSIERRAFDATDYSDDSVDFTLSAQPAAGAVVLQVNQNPTSSISPGDTLVSGSSSAKVLGTSANSITLSSSIGQPASGSTVTVYRAIPCRGQFSVNTSGAPSRRKLYQECSLLAREVGFYSLRMGFASDYAPAYISAYYDTNSTILVPAIELKGDGLGANSSPLDAPPGLSGNTTRSPRAFRTYVTTNHRRATRLYVLFVIPVSQETFSLEGISVLSSDVTSTRTVR